MHEARDDVHNVEPCLGLVSKSVDCIQAKYFTESVRSKEIQLSDKLFGGGIGDAIVSLDRKVRWRVRQPT